MIMKIGLRKSVWSLANENCYALFLKPYRSKHLCLLKLNLIKFYFSAIDEISLYPLEWLQI